MANKEDIVVKLQKCSEEMAENMPIDKVILFGSQVKGDAGKDSDIDLLVIGEEKNRGLRTEIALGFHKALPKKPVDVILKTKDEVQKRVSMGDDFIKNIIERGKVL